MSQPPNREGTLAEERPLDQSFSHIVWGRAGYMGNDDLNDPLVQPTGVSSSREAKRLMAKMVLACEQFISAEADKIESNGLEWDGAETWCVAMVSLPSAIPWGDKRGDPVGALKAEWLRRVEQEGLDADVSTEEFVEECEFEVEGGAYDGSSHSDDGGYDRAIEEFTDWLLS